MLVFFSQHLVFSFSALFLAVGVIHATPSLASKKEVRLGTVSHRSFDEFPTTTPPGISIRGPESLGTVELYAVTDVTFTPRSEDSTSPTFTPASFVSSGYGRRIKTNEDEEVEWVDGDYSADDDSDGISTNSSTSYSTLSTFSSTLGPSTSELISAYDETKPVPFGAKINVSFSAMGERFSFVNLSLDGSFSSPRLSLIGADGATVSTARMPFTTYSSTFTDPAGITTTVVASVSPISGDIVANVVRQGLPTMILQPFDLVSMGFASSPENMAQLRNMGTPTPSHVAYSSDVAQIGLGEDHLCGADELVENTNSNGENESTESSENNGSDGNDGSEEPNSGDNSIVDDEDKALSPADPVNPNPPSSESRLTNPFSRSLHSLPSFKNCHNSGKRTFTFNTGVVVDYSTYAYYSSNLSLFNLFLQNAISLNSLVYHTQFNIRWALQRVRVETTGTTAEGKTWNAKVGQCPDPETQLYAFRSWGEDNLTRLGEPRLGGWQLYTICSSTSTGTVGIAFVNAICGASRYSLSKPYPSTGVNTIGHELGHNFGSSHAWFYTSGVEGSVGGIMDYYNNGMLLSTHPTSPGEYGFHETSESPVCATLRSSLANVGNVGSEDLCFTETTSRTPVCGNGIIEEGEECETASGIMPGSSPSCCVKCRLVTNATCDQDTQCCINCRARDALTSCSSGNGFCSQNNSGEVCNTTFKMGCANPTITGCYASCGSSRRALPSGTSCTVREGALPGSGTCSISAVCVPNEYKWSLGPISTTTCRCTSKDVGERAATLLCKAKNNENVASNLCKAETRPSLPDCSHECSGYDDGSDGSDGSGGSDNGTDNGTDTATDVANDVKKAFGQDSLLGFGVTSSVCMVATAASAFAASMAYIA